MFKFFEKSDSQTQKDVVSELKSDPSAAWMAPGVSSVMCSIKIAH